MGVGRVFSRVGVISASRLVGAGIGFVTQIFLARSLSTAALGEFFFATSLAAFLAIVAAGGFPSITAKFLIRYRDRGSANLSALFMSASRRFAFRGALVVTVLALAAILLWPGLETETRIAAALGCLATLPAAMSRVGGAAATAYRRFNLSFMPDLLIRPLVFLSALVILHAVTGETNLYAVLVIFVALFALQAVYQNVRIGREIPSGPEHSRRADGMVRIWRRTAMPYVSIALYTAIFADLAILVAGLFLDRTDLAMFGVAIKITLLVGFAVNTAYQVTLPDLAEALKRRDTGRLSRAIGLANMIGLGISLVAIVGALVAGDRILQVFGPEFSGGRDYLVALLVGQFVIAAAGPSVQLLTLTGRRTGPMLASFFGVAALVALNAVLIPLLGLWGSVAAVLLVNLFWSATTAILARNAAGIGCDMFVIPGVLRSILARPRPAPAE